MKLSPVMRPSVRRAWNRLLTCSLSSSELSREHTIILLNISGRKCLGALISLTPFTASLVFLVFKYSLTTVSYKKDVMSVLVLQQQFDGKEMHKCCIVIRYIQSS